MIMCINRFCRTITGDFTIIVDSIFCLMQNAKPRLPNRPNKFQTCPILDHPSLLCPFSFQTFDDFQVSDSALLLAGIRPAGDKRDRERAEAWGGRDGACSGDTAQIWEPEFFFTVV